MKTNGSQTVNLNHLVRTTFITQKQKHKVLYRKHTNSCSLLPEVITVTASKKLPIREKLCKPKNVIETCRTCSVALSYTLRPSKGFIQGDDKLNLILHSYKEH